MKGDYLFLVISLVHFLPAMAVTFPDSDKPSIECFQDNTTIKIRKDYLAYQFGMVPAENFSVNAVYLVDSSDPIQINPDCMFTEQTNEFEIIINYTNCVSNITTSGDTITIFYRAMLATEGNGPAVNITRETCFEFTFGCKYPASFNVSSVGNVIPWLPEFNFTVGVEGSIGVEIRFLNSSFSGEADSTFERSETIYVQIDIDGPTALALEVMRCYIRNDMNMLITNVIINDYCPIAPTTKNTGTPPNIVQFSTMTPYNSLLAASIQSYTLVCMVDICDPALKACNTQVCDKRRRRANRGPGKTIARISHQFEVKDSCPDCSNGCKMGADNQMKCVCPVGYQLGKDGKICEEAVVVPNLKSSVNGQPFSIATTTTTPENAAGSNIIAVVKSWKITKVMYYIAFAMICLLMIILIFVCVRKFGQPKRKAVNVEEVQN